MREKLRTHLWTHEGQHIVELFFVIDRFPGGPGAIFPLHSRPNVLSDDDHCQGSSATRSSCRDIDHELNTPSRQITVPGPHLPVFRHTR